MAMLITLGSTRPVKPELRIIPECLRCSTISRIEPVTLKSGMRVRYQRWYDTLSAHNSKGWFVIWDSVDSFTEKQHGLPPTQPIHPNEFDRESASPRRET